MNYIHKEVRALLEAFGYKPEVKEYQTEKGTQMVDLYFHVDNGFKTMPIRHKHAISMLAKGYLSEFYYGQNTQYVKMFFKNRGLNPDDKRYGCLLHEIIRVDKDEILPNRGEEVFVNMCGHFKRFVNWNDVTSEE